MCFFKRSSSDQKTTGGGRLSRVSERGNLPISMAPPLVRIEPVYNRESVQRAGVSNQYNISSLGQGPQHQAISLSLDLPLHPPHPQGAHCHSLPSSCLFHRCPSPHLQLRGRSGPYCSRPHWPSMTTSPPEHPLIPLCRSEYPISLESRALTVGRDGVQGTRQ